MPEFIYIPVPSQWAPAIYKRLAELEDEDAPPALPAAAPTVTLDAALVEQMYRESHSQHRRLMEYLADHPGEWFYTSELADSLEIEKKSRGVAGMLGAFGKRSNNRYGGLKPWETRWDGVREEARHRMSLDSAEVISKVAASVGESG
ncbi:MAG TPA: DUF6416 domain-containing protein [Solirubrobacteraceae bacterium]|jgi:hypothetical protein|nr:DUF6416 domain-containing protein [Solirubrobacteraceae bacterium]